MSRSARNLVVFAGLLAAAAGVTLVLLPWSGGEHARKGESDTPRMQWTVGDRAAYEFSVDVDALIEETNLRRHRIRQNCSGTLHMRVFGGVDTVIVGFQVEDMRITVEGKAGQEPIGPVDGPPFWVEFEPSGEIRDAVFHADTNAGTRQILEETIRAFQCVVPPGSGVRWSTRETHSTGYYAADYAVTLRGNIRKNKTAYDTDGVTVERSTGNFELSDKSWLANASVRDRISIAGEDGSLVRARTAATLKALGTDAAAPSAVLRATYGDALLAMERHRTAPQPDADGSEPRFTEAEVRTTLLALNASDGQHTKLLRKLSRQIESDPAFIRLVLEKLEAEETSDGTAAAMVTALGMANTEEANAALAEILRDPERRHQNRRRATIALGFSWKPNETVMGALWNAADDRGTATSKDLSNTALLAIGTTTGTLRELGAASYSGNRARLIRRVDRAADQEEASAYALRLMKDPTVVDRLADRLDRETDIEVRHDVAASMNRLRIATPRSIALARARVAIEKDESTRYELVAFLARHRDRMPDWRGTFEEFLRVENSSRIRKALGRALFAKQKTQRRD
jgi:hypothetical protein